MRFEKTRTGWDAILPRTREYPFERRIHLRSSDGTGKVGSRQGGWTAYYARTYAHGDTRKEAVTRWLTRHAPSR